MLLSDALCRFLGDQIALAAFDACTAMCKRSGRCSVCRQRLYAVDAVLLCLCSSSAVFSAVGHFGSVIALSQVYCRAPVRCEALLEAWRAAASKSAGRAIKAGSTLCEVPAPIRRQRHLIANTMRQARPTLLADARRGLPALFA